MIATVKPIATIKPDWVAPKPPVKKCTACGEVIKPVAYQDADGWVLAGWDCENYCNTVDEIDNFEWPFVEDCANYVDMEKAGFVVV